MTTIRRLATPRFRLSGCAGTGSLSWSRDPLGPPRRRDDPPPRAARDDGACDPRPRSSATSATRWCCSTRDDPDPFWNRMVSVRWPDEPLRVRSSAQRDHHDVRARRAAAAHLAVARAQRARRPRATARSGTGSAMWAAGTSWCSRTRRACPPVDDRELDRQRDDRRHLRSRRRRLSGDIDDIAAVLAESFGALPGRARRARRRPARRTLGDPRVVAGPDARGR